MSQDDDPSIAINATCRHRDVSLLMVAWSFERRMKITRSRCPRLPVSLSNLIVSRAVYTNERHVDGCRWMDRFRRSIGFACCGDKTPSISTISLFYHNEEIFSNGRTSEVFKLFFRYWRRILINSRNTYSHRGENKGWNLQEKKKKNCR